MSKKVPVTLSWDSTEVIGYVTVDDDLIIKFDSDNKRTQALRKLLEEGLLKMCSLSFSIDGRKISVEEIQAKRQEFRVTLIKELGMELNSSGPKYKEE